MDQCANLPDKERKLYFEQTAAKMGHLPFVVEKDFWVCWTLKELFSLPEWGQHLTFKGGTSLSKAWKLIERFSEDIDLVIDREFLGFGKDKDPASAPSKKQTKNRLEELKKASQEQVKTELLPTLETHFSSILKGGDWSLKMAEDDDDPQRQTILFLYPSLFPDVPRQMRRDVKMEFGARSDPEPSSTATVTPFVSECFPDAFKPASCEVMAVNAERTFLEKAMLLHEEGFRPADKKRKPGLSRHYYDLYQLIRKGVAGRAIQDRKLFEKVAEHRPVFFRQSWVDYTTLKYGELRLIPQTDLMDYWRSDYRDMSGEMFSRTAPDFDEVMQTIDDFKTNWKSS
ncbi:MAG: nucleotidyl transferase AbiEii/AbiGii toxin family protein [Verrucomicrobiota bacterium]